MNSENILNIDFNIKEENNKNYNITEKEIISNLLRLNQILRTTINRYRKEEAQRLTPKYTKLYEDFHMQYKELAKTKYKLSEAERIIRINEARSKPTFVYTCCDHCFINRNK